MTEHRRLARQSSVKACRAPLEIGRLLIRKSADLPDQVSAAARRSAPRLTAYLDVIESALTPLCAFADGPMKRPSAAELPSGLGS